MGLPPDPFKPLCLQHKNANLDTVIENRRNAMPPRERYIGSIYSRLIKDFENKAGIGKNDCRVFSENPDIDISGRVRIPKIVDVYSCSNQASLGLSDETLSLIQLPTSRDDLKLEHGTIVREVFDFDNGYRIEFINVTEE